MIVAGKKIARIVAVRGTVAVRMALVALAVVLIVPTAHSEQRKQQPPAAEQQPPEPSASAVKMAREIIELKGTVTLLSPLVGGVIERIRSLHLQTNPGLRKDLDESAAVLRKQFAPRSAELAQDVSKHYASAFTEAELKEIVAFYRTATGKKVIAVEPVIFEDAMQGLKDWQEGFAEEVLAAFRTEMKKRGHSL